MTLVNWSIIREPYNWITVAVMLSFAAIAITLLANGGRLPGSDGEVGIGTVAGTLFE